MQPGPGGVASDWRIARGALVPSLAGLTAPVAHRSGRYLAEVLST